jgi:hypothetical protein
MARTPKGNGIPRKKPSGKIIKPTAAILPTSGSASAKWDSAGYSALPIKCVNF